MKRLLAIVALCLVFDIPASSLFSQTITTASDNGANYSGGWSNGSNGGTGFQVWNIWSSGGTNRFAGNFVGNPASGGVTGMAANSFGLYANPIGSGAYANAERRLNTSLAIGQTLSFQWSINYDSGSGGDKGFNLYSGGEEILNINNAGSEIITCNGGNVGFAYGTNAMTWSFTRTDATTISVTANGRNGTDSFSTNIVAAGGAIDRVKFYASAMQGGNEAQPYFNNLTVTEPVATSMAVPGDYAFFGGWATDGTKNTGMTVSDPAKPNLWTSNWRRFSDARTIAFKFAANGTFDFSWGTDPARPSYAKRGGDAITQVIPSTGLYRFSFDQSTLQYSLIRATSADLSYEQLANIYLLGGEVEDDDNDGLTNVQEYLLSTDPSNSDSDADSLLDGYEVNTSQTSPLVSDSDNDGLPDWWEVANGLNPNSDAANDGASGDPDIDTFTNKQEFEGQSNPASSASVPANREVSFTVDLSREIAAGTFSANSSAVEVWGTFNDWGNFTNKYSLTSNGSGIYSGTFVVPGANGATSRYKFVTFDGNNTLSWEPGSDRVLVMGANGEAIILPVAYLGEVRPVTFSVNMSVQVALGRFTHGTNKVYLVGDVVGSWNVPGTELARVGSSDVYSAEVLVAGAQNATANYKFYANNSLAFETDLDASMAGDQTRVLILGARDTAETLPVAYFNNVDVVPSNRTVTFAVDMGVQRELGNFNPASDKVYLVGDAVGDWATGVEMLREGSTDVFKITQQIEGALGTALNYKFKSGNGAVGNEGYEGDVNPDPALGKDARVLTLGATDSPQYEGTVFFNNVTQVRSLTFKVDMGVQVTKNEFAHGDNLEVRFGNFNAGGKSLTREGSTTVYSGTFPVTGDAGDSFEYKFWKTNAAKGAVFERVDAPRTNNFLNRTYTLGSNGVAVTLSPTPFFSNDDGVAPEITLDGDATINLTVGGNYTELGATATKTGEGSLTATPSGSVDTTTAGTYTITYTAIDAAGNTATKTRTVVVATAGSTFAGWSSNALVTSELVGKYGIGGATSSSAASERPEPGLDSNTLSLSAIVRTNDAKLKVEGEASGSLTNWSTNGVTMTASPNTNGVPGGHQRQVFSVDRTNSPTKQFLRLKATLAP